MEQQGKSHQLAQIALGVFQFHLPFQGVGDVLLWGMQETWDREGSHPGLTECKDHPTAALSPEPPPKTSCLFIKPINPRTGQGESQHKSWGRKARPGEGCQKSQENVP
jgi:hypothetical protein